MSWGQSSCTFENTKRHCAATRLEGGREFNEITTDATKSGTRALV